MRNGICSKCNSPTVQMGRNVVHLGDEHTFLFPHMDPNFRGIRAGHRTDDLWIFACVSCGYLEFHLLDAQAIAFIRDRWLEVPAQPQAPQR